MPSVSRFRGVTIVLYYEDHNPPHFHARAGGDELVVQIDPVGTLEGRLPTPDETLVLEWARSHQRDLMDNWERARQHEPLTAIPSVP